MALASGTTLGPYVIDAALGVGGMGEVYRATDTNLKRQVAIKVLPDALADDGERLARFRREAEVLAALNHPNIAHVHGLERSDGTTALVMELVEGEDLSQRLAGGALPIDEALAIARQIAEALEAAHEQGIIHRDLKPANIKVRPDGTVKVLDFGLAKALEPSGATPSNATVAPTITSPAMTQAGIILGTAAYMSPEQASGKPADRRSDLWAFGAVLMEMLTGRRVFEGETVSHVLASVLKDTPDWTTLPTDTPPAVRRLLRRCLEKQPKRRLAASADAILELDEAVTPTPSDDGHASAPAYRWPHGWLVAVAIGVLTVATAVSTWGWMRAARDASPPPSTGAYVAATLGVGVPRLSDLVDRFAVSPDGTMLAFHDSVRGGLRLRRSSSLDVRPIAGTPPGAYAPVFSPDGQWIAFATGEALMKIPAAGGTPTFVAGRTAERDIFINLTWGADGRIRYPSLHYDAIRSVPASGGPVDTIALGPRVRVVRAEGLPEGRLLVSVMIDRQRQIAVREADGTLRTLIDGWDARLTPTGYLLFSREEGTSWSLVAAPFDPITATLSGDATVLAADVPVHFATPAAASATGDLFYLANPPRSDRRVVVVDRAGAERELAIPHETWQSVHASPDGLRLALGRWEGARRTIWTLALDTGALTPVTYRDDTFAPRWMPDGRRLLFSHFPFSAEANATSIWSVATDGGGTVEPVAAQWDAYPGGVASDGATLYYGAYRSDAADMDILAIALGGSAPKPVVLLATPASEAWPQPSPDGRWIAYQTDASGRVEARVAPLADLGASVQVSTRGGRPLGWGRDRSSLYYTDGDDIRAVDIGPRGPVLTSRRVAFAGQAESFGGVDVMPDGQHAVAIRGGLIYSDLVVVQGALPPRRD